MVRVQEIGDGAPVLLVHGASNGGASWAPLIAGLTGFRCIALDRPGCGLSDPAETGGQRRGLAAIESFADRLVADVLDALELPRSHVVATSYGGYFAFRGAAAHPDRIDRVVEMSWPFGAPLEQVSAALRIAAVPGLGSAMAWMPPTRRAVRLLLRQIGLAGALESGRFTAEMLDWYLALLRDTPTLRNELRASPELIAPIRGLNEDVLFSAGLLRRVAAPTLFIWGADDPNGGPETARRFTERLPNATLEVLTDAGHAPWIDEPELAAELTSRFLAG